MKKIKVNIEPMVGVIYDDWDGQGYFKQYLRRKENVKRMEDFIKATANTSFIQKITFELTERYATIYFEDIVSRDILNLICDRLTQRQLMSFISLL